jgi:hypothetical protein
MTNPDTITDPTNGEENDCDNCGEIIYLAGDGQGWLHQDTNRPRCWPGHDYIAVPVEDDDEDATEARRIGQVIKALDEEEKPYSARRLVVRRVPEYGWAVFDKDSGAKMRPVNPNQWFAKRSTALAAKATEA